MTLASTIPTDLDGLEIGNIPKTPIDLQTLQSRMAQQNPILASMLAFLKQIQNDPYSIFASGTGDYKIELLSGSLFLGSSGASTAGVPPYSGDFYVGIVMDTNGLSIGYNRKDTGAWVRILDFSAAGSVMYTEFNGTHYTGSIGSTVNVSGNTMGDINTWAARAGTAINDSGVVVANVSATSVYGTTLTGTDLSLSGSITGILGSVSCVGNINSVTSVSSSTLVTAPVIVATSGLSVTSGYIDRPWSATGRLTVNDQSSPYAAVGTFTYSFHL